MQYRFFQVKFQVFLWVITIVSILLNVYLVASKVVSYIDVADILADDEDELVETTNVAQNVPALSQQWVLGADGLISIDVNKAESLEVVLASANINTEKLSAILSSIKQTAAVTQVKPGSRIQIQVAASSASKGAIDPRKITLFFDVHKVETTFNHVSNTFETTKMNLPLEWQVKVVSGKINGSLFSSLRKAGAEPTIVSQLVNLFSYDIDFQRDIKAGDNFRVMYEYQTDYRGKVVKNPKIMYANLNLGGKTKELFRHLSAANSVEYFDKKGNSIKKALLRTPINGAKITSNFGLRMHPVLGYSRMHQGLDYGAPKGTPVLAAGDGVVVGVKNLSRGYGKHVQIKHTNSYETLYGHLSRFASNVRPGARVKQGQVIGYVGSTGLASGPHLHYEVIFNGKKVNPTKIKIPNFIPLKGTELAKFKDNVRKLEQMVAELDDKKASSVALMN